MRFIDAKISPRSLNIDKIQTIEAHKGKRAVLTDTNEGIIDVEIIENQKDKGYSVIIIEGTEKRDTDSITILHYHNLEQLYVATK